MPEYLSPGVYIEETSIRSALMAPVDTAATAFVGPTLAAPDEAPFEPLTSFAAFERAYGGLGPLEIAGAEGPNYVAHAAKAFFANGGRQLHIAHVPIPKDGGALTVKDYAGAEGALPTGLAALKDRRDITLVAAPGATANAALGVPVMRALIDDAAQKPFRFAVLDSIRGQSLDGVRALRLDIDAQRAALYYPWVLVDDPMRRRWWRRRRLALPPSGFVCGIYARVDQKRGVFKAPADEEVLSACGLERRLNDAEQSILNPENINCLRWFPGRGAVVRGARTLSTDPEWKYVNVRRYISYLEQSIVRDTQWVVFEPHNDSLWAKLRQQIEQFLHAEWRAGGLAGNSPDEAFSVRCDRTTMTERDIDDGWLIFEIGVAAIKPAEFVTIRIRQNLRDGEI